MPAKQRESLAVMEAAGKHLDLVILNAVDQTMLVRVDASKCIG
jgi:hypothetical protein